MPVGGLDLGKINRAKVIAQAHKYLSKGNLRKAVREYEKVLKEDPSDIRTKLKVADIWFRLGEKEKAVETFEEVAKFYSSQGFLLKAVAVYKQLQKLKPDDVDIHLSLASLYQQIGLVNDAITQYKEAINLYDRGGFTLERLRCIQKMLELDPENAKLRVALAEDYSKEGMIEEAVHLFRDACEILKKQGYKEEYVVVAERLLYHQPDDYEISKEIADYYIEKGDSLRALTRLSTCFKAKPNDPEVLEKLAVVFEQLGQLHKAVTVLKALADQYNKSGLIKERDEVYKKVYRLSPGDISAAEALQFVPPEEIASTEGEIEFETSPANILEELPQVPDEEEEIGIDEMVEDTNPDQPFTGAEEPSPTFGLDSEENLEATLVERLPDFLVHDHASKFPDEMMVVPKAFQDDIKQIEFLIDAGLKEDALTVLQEVKARAGNLPILERFEALLKK